MERRPISFTLAHLSDLHVTPIHVGSWRELANKRALGFLSWRRRRRHEHRAEVLEALLEDLRQERPDHVAITGDLTNVGLRSEIDAAAPWLQELGGPARVSIVPGNHDSYAAPVERERFSAWSPYLEDAREGSPSFEFPYLRRAGPLALVGLCSAVPTAPGLATGKLGEAQLSRLEPLLLELGRAGSCRVVLVHHPPVPAGQSRRRRLSDASALRGVLARAGAELVLHGHTHRTSFAHVDGPKRPIPVVGVPSSSADTGRAERRARYHLYRLAPDGEGFRVACRVRVLERDGPRFVDGPEHAL